MVVTAKKSCMIKDNATFIINLVLEKWIKHFENPYLFSQYYCQFDWMQYKINLFALITNYLNILLPFSPILLLMRSSFKEVRVTHFAIPSPKYFAPFSPILLLLRYRFKEVRVTHFAISSPKYFAPFSPIVLPSRFRFKEVRVTHSAIPSPKYFAPFSPIVLS